MNPRHRFVFLKPVSRTILTLLSLLLTMCVLKAADTTTAPEEAVLGEQVVQLLKTKDVGKFASELSSSVKDWQSVRTNTPNLGSPVPDIKSEERRVEYEKQKVAASAQQVVDLADRLGLYSSQVQFSVKSVEAKGQGNFEAYGAKVPWVNEIKVILLGKPNIQDEANKKFGGEYELALGGGIKFPAGWRSYEGIRWTRFPEGVADSQTSQDMKLISAVASHTRTLTEKDDPTLTSLGNTLIRFLQKKDEKIFATEAMLSLDETWNKYEKEFAKKSGGQKMPPRKEFEESWTGYHEEIFKSVRGVLNQAATLGIDFANAKVTLKSVVAKNPYARGGKGSVEGIEANSIQFTFNVDSDQKSKSDRPIAGEYKLAVERGQRQAARWTLEGKARWEEFPKGLLDEKELADLNFENYVAEHDALPPGTTAPDMEMTQIDNDKKVKLSELRGKIVVIDFWATWCGPCQEPMAHLQTLREHNPEWKDRVAVLSLSIDDELKTPREHLAKRGWTNSVNMWAGDGGWKSEPAKQFRVTGVPTMYVIDAQGKVAQGGHFLGDTVPNLVNSLLKQSGK